MVPRKPKAELIVPNYRMHLDTLAGVHQEMARLYRMGLNGKIKTEEMTRFVYVLKEIRCCIEAQSKGELRAVSVDPRQAAVRALHSIVG